MFSVMLPQLETIGRMLGGFLWIFSGGRIWKFYEYLVGIQNSNHVFWINPSSFSVFSFSVISSLRVGVGSSFWIA